MKNIYTSFHQINTHFPNADISTDRHTIIIIIIINSPCAWVWLCVCVRSFHSIITYNVRWCAIAHLFIIKLEKWLTLADDAWLRLIFAFESRSNANDSREWRCIFNAKMKSFNGTLIGAPHRESKINRRQKEKKNSRSCHSSSSTTVRWF